MRYLTNYEQFRSAIIKIEGVWHLRQGFTHRISLDETEVVRAYVKYVHGYKEYDQHRLETT